MDLWVDMALAFDGAAAGSSAAATQITYSHTNNGNILVVGASTESNGVVGTVTYNGVSMTPAGTATNNSSEKAYLFYLLNPTSGANNVVVSVSASVGIRSCSVSYTGAQQSGQPDATSMGSIAAGTTISGTLTTVANNDWIIGYSNSSTGGSPTASTGVTSRANTDTSRIGDSNGAITPAGAGTMTFTNGASADMNLVMMAISPSVAASARILSTNKGYW